MFQILGQNSDIYPPIFRLWQSQITCLPFEIMPCCSKASTAACAQWIQNNNKFTWTYLLKFHSKLKLTKPIWGYAKYHELLFAFKLSLYSWYKICRLLQHIWWQIEHSKSSCPAVSGHVWHDHCFFRKVWQYMDMYQGASLHIIRVCTTTDIFSQRGPMWNRLHLL